MQAALPPDEAKRLHALKSYDVLDTEPEAEYDRIIFLAAQLFGVPIALVSLVDEQRQWFKARCGLDSAETPRVFSFCAHALLGDDVMMVPDALADPRFKDNPFVTGEPHIRFYAGAPLVTPDGHKLGTLCVIDRQPRHPGKEQLEALGCLAALVVDELTLRRTAKENARLATAIESMDIGVVLVDPRLPDQPMTQVNAAFERITGYGRNEVVGRNCRFLQGPDTDRGEIARMRAAISARERFEGTLLNYRKDGTTFWNAVRLRPVWDRKGRCVSYVGLQTDLTMQCEAEQVRRDKEAAEQANLAKSEFLSRMSHELRTPLNAILGFGQLLELSPALGEESASVGYILDAGRHLLKLVDEVLDIARIESGHLELSSEAVRLDDLLSEAISLVRPLANQRSIEMREKPPAAFKPHVAADPLRLKQVLLNLLSNAVKYNASGGVVTVGLALTPGTHRARVSVADTGTGVPAAMRGRLFTPFDRLGAESGSVAGTGLGLALSKQLIVAMGGRIGYEENPGGGAVFWIELPLTASASHDAPPMEWASEETLPAGRTLLYIEDNAPNRQLVERLVAKFPAVSLLTAARADAGLALAREHRPDLILLDLHLPDLPGTEVLARLRHDPATRDTPVVVVSADATPGQVARLRAEGAAAYLTKPFDVRHLLRVVRRAMVEKDEG